MGAGARAREERERGRDARPGTAARRRHLISSHAHRAGGTLADGRRSRFSDSYSVR